MKFWTNTHRVVKSPYNFQSCTVCIESKHLAGIVRIQGDEVTLVLQSDVDYLAIRGVSHKGGFLSEVRDKRNRVNGASFKPNHARVKCCGFRRQSEHV